MLYWALVEQAPHEHMSDEYKDRYIIQCCRSPHPGSIGPTRDHHMIPTELTLSGKIMRQNNNLPNTYYIVDRLLKLSCILLVRIFQ